MKKEKIMVANLKCNGCATTVKKELQKIEGIQTVEVDIENDCVDVSYENVDRDVIIKKLHALGYPEATEKNGLLLQLKSYASCMIGRVSNLAEPQS
jgi:copper chaperone CopZ